MRGLQDVQGTCDRFEFFRVELIKQASFAEVEGSSRLTFGTVSLRSIVEAPACCAASDCSAKIGQEVGGEQQTHS